MSERKRPDNASKYFGMGFKMVIAAAGCAFSGHYLDTTLSLKFPVFTLILSLVGAALAIYIVIRDTKQ